MVLKGWKTVIFNVITALVGVAEATDWTGLIGDPAAGYALIAVAMVNTILRFVTTTPVGKAVE